MDTNRAPRYGIIYIWPDVGTTEELRYPDAGHCGTLPWTGKWSVRSEWTWLLAVGATPIRVERVNG